MAQAPDASESRSTPLSPWRSAFVVQLMAAAMRGVDVAIYGPKEEPAIVVAAPSDPPDPDDPLTVKLDFEHPEESVVILRPWRLSTD